MEGSSNIKKNIQGGVNIFLVEKRNGKIIIGRKNHYYTSALNNYHSQLYQTMSRD